MLGAEGSYDRVGGASTSVGDVAEGPFQPEESHEIVSSLTLKSGGI